MAKGTVPLRGSDVLVNTLSSTGSSLLKVRTQPLWGCGAEGQRTRDRAETSDCDRPHAGAQEVCPAGTVRVLLAGPLLLGRGGPAAGAAAADPTPGWGGAPLAQLDWPGLSALLCSPGRAPDGSWDDRVSPTTAPSLVGHLQGQPLPHGDVLWLLSVSAKRTGGFSSLYLSLGEKRPRFRELQEDFDIHRRVALLHHRPSGSMSVCTRDRYLRSGPTLGTVCAKSWRSYLWLPLVEWRTEPPDL